MRLQGARFLVGLFLLSLPLVTPRLRGADEIEYFSYLRSLAFHRDSDQRFDGSPYDRFLARNGLPTGPDPGEPDTSYARRLRDRLQRGWLVHGRHGRSALELHGRGGAELRRFARSRNVAEREHAGADDGPR